MMDRMKMLLFVTPLILLFSGCVSDEVGNGSAVSPGSAATRVSVSWQKRAVAGGSEVFLRLNGTDHFVARARNFNETYSGDYGRMGIPVNAVIAGIYWAEDAHEEDAEGVYAVVEGREVVVYRGYYSPGEMENTEWSRKMAISF